MRTEGVVHISEILAQWQPPAPDEDVEDAAEPNGRFVQRWRIAVVGVVVIALAVALAVFAWPRSEDVTQPAAVAPVVPTAVPDPIDDLSRAFDAWGRFAISRDVALVEPWFADGGPQLEQLRLEAEMLALAPIGGAPYEFGLEGATVAASGIGRETIRSAVALSRPGEAEQRYVWEIDMRWSEEAGRWQVWTVRTAD